MSAFARLFRSLQTAYPPSGLATHRVGELLDTIQPVAQMPAPGALAPTFFPFLISAAAGVDTVETAVVTSELWTPYIVLTGSHDDPVSRQMAIDLVGTSAGGLTIVTRLQSSTVDGPTAGVATNDQFSLRRLIWVPPNFKVRVRVFAIAAGAFASIRGITAQVNLAEPSPPLF